MSDDEARRRLVVRARAAVDVSERCEVRRAAGGSVPFPLSACGTVLPGFLVGVSGFWEWVDYIPDVYGDVVILTGGDDGRGYVAL